MDSEWAQRWQLTYCLAKALKPQPNSDAVSPPPHLRTWTYGWQLALLIVARAGIAGVYSCLYVFTLEVCQRWGAVCQGSSAPGPVTGQGCASWAAGLAAGRAAVPCAQPTAHYFTWQLSVLAQVYPTSARNFAAGISDGFGRIGAFVSPFAVGELACCGACLLG